MTPTLQMLLLLLVSVVACSELHHHPKASQPTAFYSPPPTLYRPPPPSSYHTYEPKCTKKHHSVKEYSCHPSPPSCSLHYTTTYHNHCTVQYK